MYFLQRIVITLIFCHLWAGILPENGSELNYTQIFFKWEQFPGAASYEIIISETEGFESYSNSIIANSILLTEFISWDSNYIWSICSYSADGIQLSCSEDNNFSINSLPDYFPNDLSVLEYDEATSQEGIIVKDFESLNVSGAINKMGVPILFIGKDNFEQKFIFTEFLPNGNILGYEPGIGYEIDLNGNIIFQTPNDLNSLHHHITKSSRATYFLISAYIQDQYCPQECNSSLPDEIPWQGDIFREFDKNGNEIWTWNTFDHYELSEYNPYYVETYTGSYEMDWTHSNSIVYDEDSESVIISVRNLSRITKIDYNTKQIIWNLGQIDFMNNISFGEDLNFSQQHSVQLLKNGNLLFFDNHRYLSPQLSRCLEVAISEDVSNNDYENIAQIVWEHELPPELFSGSRGECDRLENGNTLITVGRTGHNLEVTPNNDTAWHLDVKYSGLALSTYRSDLIPNLYPVAFSISIEEFSGDENNSFVTPNSGIITANVHSSGWQESSFTLKLLSVDNNELFSENIDLEPFANISLSIDVSNFPSTNYNLIAYSNKAPQKIESFEFYLNNGIILGDLNDDGGINILDVVILANIIISGTDTNPAGDLNQDGGLNVLDIVSLVNIILYD